MPPNHVQRSRHKSTTDNIEKLSWGRNKDFHIQLCLDVPILFALMCSMSCLALCICLYLYIVVCISLKHMHRKKILKTFNFAEILFILDYTN